MKTHGMRNTSTYQVWIDMVRRCHKPNHPAYPGYGGRGIKVCDEWRRFEGFFASMGHAPEGLTLERIRDTALRSKARRDRIATATLSALLIKSTDADVKPADFAQGAVAQADALIAELDK